MTINEALEYQRKKYLEMAEQLDCESQMWAYCRGGADAILALKCALIFNNEAEIENKN